MADSNADLARRFAVAFNERDVDGMLELVSEDFVLIPVRAAVEDTRYEGHEGLRQWMRDLAETWSDLAVEVTDVSEPAPGTVLVLGRIRLRGHGGDVPIETDAGWVARIRDGLCERLDTYLDQGDASRAAAPR